MTAPINWCAVDGVAVALIPKNANTSIFDILSEYHEYTIIQPPSVFDVPTRIAFVRDPFERLVSAYSFFRALLSPAGSVSDIVPAEAVQSWASFVDHTLTHDDNHWLPQCDLLTHGGRVVPTHVYRFERLHEIWQQYFDGLLPWLRAVKHKNVDAHYRADELVKKYSGDTAWRSLAL